MNEGLPDIVAEISPDLFERLNSDREMMILIIERNKVFRMIFSILNNYQAMHNGDLPVNMPVRIRGAGRLARVCWTLVPQTLSM